jgi:LPS sulfotransferase NodH
MAGERTGIIMNMRFVIVGAARTGSTLLVRTLNRLDGVCCHGELLALAVRGFVDDPPALFTTQVEKEKRAARLLRERKEDPAGFLQSALSRDCKATGFKALYESLLNPAIPDIMETLLAMPDVRFIHLVRRNNLRRFISDQIMRAGGPIHSGLGGRGKQKIKVHVEIAEFQHNCLKIQRQQDAVLELLSGKEILEVVYEDLAADTTAMVSRVGQFLDLNFTHLTDTLALEKVGASDLRESVSNFEELLHHEATRDLVLRQ